LRAYVLVQAEHNEATLAQRLMTVPGVAFAENVTGAYDAIAVAAAASMRQLFDNVIAKILKLPGVTRALPAPLIRSAGEQPETEGDPFDGEPGSGHRAA
jgi:DNA-binding Lrp family transcriptional regulator